MESTYKSNDTEEWLDRVWTRPIGYGLARMFARLNVHPNTVTILSMIIGAVSSLFFAHGSWRTEGEAGLICNIIAVCLLAMANFLDSADGQLARMTGKKTRLGRILDGAASEVWFIPIYLSLVYRFYIHHSLEFSWFDIPDTSFTTNLFTIILFFMVLYSGFVCHSRQCGLADYYRQAHLFFLKGEEGSELDTAHNLKEIYADTPWKGNVLWKLFLKSYIGYTHRQESKSICFQMLMSQLYTRYGSAELIPQEVRDEYSRNSLPLMKWTNILTFNTRAIVLYTVCLIDLPWIYFLFEIFIMGGITLYMNVRHERMCRRLMYLPDYSVGIRS